MYPSPDADVRHRVAILFSERSREAYAAEAAARSETYSFTDAWGNRKRWLKGEHAYLSPNAASAILSRCNLKHDWLEERELSDETIGGYQALLVPNAGHLADETLGRLERWLQEGNGRLIVGGRTNLPERLLGLARRAPADVSVYTGWRWLPDSPFGDRAAWEEYYVTGYAGHTVHQVEVAPGSRVLAELVEFGGDLSSAAAATKRTLGPAIVATDRTVYIANGVFELLGGVMQAHLNVEAVRRWHNPIHWGDTLALFLRQLLIEVGLGSLWETRLRSFGAYEGAFSYRQDIHGDLDTGFLEYEVANLIPATFDIEDPAISDNTNAEQARRSAELAEGYSFIERGLHNDSVVGDPPRAIQGTGLYDHVRSAERNLGFPVYSCGRHGGGHMHPETIDAMDYLYANHDRVLGMCTFSFYQMTEYGVRNPDVVVAGKPITYQTNAVPTIATPGFWFPFHTVVTTDAEWRVLRGWDRTHEYDCSYDLVEAIFGGHNARLPGLDDRLENPVYSLQYHPEFANDPSKNGGRGTFDYLRYAISLATRRNFWIANERELYARMADYQDLAFRVEDDGTVLVHNPTGRRIVGMAIEQRRPFGSVWDGSGELVHVVGGSIVTLPPLGPGERKTIRFEARPTGAPRIAQPGHRGLVILDARHDHETGETRVLVDVCRDQTFQMAKVVPSTRYRVHVDSEPERLVESRVLLSMEMLLAAQLKGGWAGASGGGAQHFLRVDVSGEQNGFVERTIRVSKA